MNRRSLLRSFVGVPVGLAAGAVAGALPEATASAAVQTVRLELDATGVEALVAERLAAVSRQIVRASLAAVADAQRRCGRIA